MTLGKKTNPDEVLSRLLKPPPDWSVGNKSKEELVKQAEELLEWFATELASVELDRRKPKP